ncbi:MAG TPA: hypothetical protein VFZ98_12665 [Vicinamibacterales bacterium]
MRQISGPRGNHPRWTKDGRELVYWVLGGGLESVDLQFEGTTFRASAPRSLIAAPILGLIDGRTHYDATRDGERFLLRQPTEPHAPAAITVLLDWTEAIKK